MNVRSAKNPTGPSYAERELPTIGSVYASQRISAAYESSPFGMSFTSAQPANFGAYVMANPAYCAITGYTLEQLCTMTARQTIHPEYHEVTLQSAQDLLAGTAKGVDAVMRIIRPDGSTVWVRQHRCLMHDQAGQPLHFLAHTEDISEQRASEAALIEAQRRFRSAFDNAPIGMTLASANVDRPDRYIEVNRAFCEMTRYSSKELLQRSFLDITHPDDRTVNATLWKSLLRGDIPMYQFEKRYVRSDGITIWVLVNTSLSHDADGRPLHKITQIMDISDRKRYEAQLQHLAMYDSLTGLLNRQQFEIALEQNVRLDSRNGAKLAIALIDLDNFKCVNDSLGHVAGDELLCRIAKVLTSKCRATDVIARLGGDEFGIILRDVDAVDADRIANDIRAAIRDDTMVSAMRSLFVSASIGVAFLDSEQHTSAQELLVAADMAMYDAKKSGRNRVSLTQSIAEPQAQRQARFIWVERIRDALLHDRFVLYAQPMLNLATNAVERHELLLRMLDEDGRLVLPTEFLPTAERFGLMGEVNKWVIRKTIAALRQGRSLKRALNLSVNISATSLIDPDVFEFTKHELLQETSSIAPRSLFFEIAGMSAITNIEEARQIADALRELGCAFSLDDFGAGLNSFGFLKLLAFETVKIDSSFIKAIGDSALDRVMVDAMVQVVAGLGKETVAECVENDRTLTIVRDAGVNFAQGTYIGSPRKLSDVLL